MTQSAFSDSTTTAPRAEPPAAQPPALPREAAEFLVELSVTLQKRSMYPPGHPYLQTSTERLMRRVEILLAAHPIAVFGIARDQIVIEGAATDARNTIYRDLAERLHRHRLATLRLSRGITTPELDRLVTLLCGEPVRSGRGALVTEMASLEHVQVQPIEYDRIVLEEGDAGLDTGGAAPRRSDDLWMDLARIAADTSTDGGDFEDDGALINRIESGSTEAGYDREILGRLTRLAEELADTSNPRDQALQARLSKLLGSLRSGTLTRLLAAGEDDDERRRFVTAASTSLDIGAVMKILESIAAASHQEVSHHLLRLLRKMGKMSPAAPTDAKLAADAALRANVNRLLEDWRLDDPNPERYTAALDMMAMTAPREGAAVESCDPIVILQAALESGTTGRRIDLATREALSSGRFDELIALLQDVPSGAQTDSIWARVATPERLRDELKRGRLLNDSTAALITRLGPAAVDPLLELLAEADDRAMRSATLRALAGLGGVAADRAVALMPNSPWFVQRNLFVLLGRLGSWPEKLPTAPYVAHEESRVRREAIKLMLDSPGRRDTALSGGIMDSDDTIRSLALSAALEECPRHIVPTVKRIVDDPAENSAIRTLAIKVFARSGISGAVESLTSLVLVRKFRFLPRRIAAKSPEVLAAIAGLSAHWSSEPRAAEVLQRARRHRDPEIRAAAGAEP